MVGESILVTWRYQRIGGVRMANIDDLKGRELDALVAERIMGWKLDPSRTADDGSPLVLSELSRFSENPPAARGVMLLLEQRHPGIAMHQESESPYKFVVRGPSGRTIPGRTSRRLPRCAALC